MLLFLFLLLPAALCAFFLYTRERKYLPVLFIGTFTAILLCVIKALFVFSHRVVPNSFMQNYFFYALNESLLPQLVIFGIYCLVAKDDCKLKLSSYFPLICSFYALYIPYCVISANESEIYSGFAIFAKPLMYLAMFIQCEICLNCIAKTDKAKIFRVILSYFVLTVYLLLPALLEVLYVMNLLQVLFYIILVSYITLPFAELVFKVIKKPAISDEL